MSQKRVLGIAVDVTARREYEEAARVYEGLKGQYEVLAGQMGSEAASKAVMEASENLEKAKAAMRRDTK